MAYHKSMADIWSRLKEIGYDRNFVVSTILPDWWDDKLAAIPTNRALAEMTIARQLDISLSHLQDPKKKLQRPRAGGARLKKWSNVEREEIGPTVQVASRLAYLIALGMREAPAFHGLPDALEIRDEIISASPSRYVNFENLLSYCWQHGMPVAQLGRFPKYGKKIDGLAAIYENRPLIILASRRDALPWLAFHLAHEMGHVARGHISSEAYRVDLESQAETKEEKEADDFANRLLFGVEDFRMGSKSWLKAEVLAAECNRLQPMYRLDAGLMIVNYGKTMQQWAAAEAALKILGQNAGAKELIRKYFVENFQKDNLPDSSLNFISKITGISD